MANSVCSYLLSYKNSIYLAYQKAYVRNLWAQLCDAVKTLFQIVLIVLTGNFILYLAVQFVMQFIPNIIVSVKVDKEFPYLKECRELPEKEKFHGILRNVGAMSFHKLGTVIVRNTDSLLMSSFVGLLSVGIYSNYKLVLSGINNLMDKFSNAFTGSLGNLGANLGNLLAVEGAVLLDAALEVGAAQVLHDDVVRVAVLAPVIDRDDVRALQCCRGLGLLLEARRKRGVVGVLRQHRLDGHGAAQDLVLSAVDRGHAAGANPVLNLVASA